jgi:membrane protein insertase Oxa1/YidC/SpoIIIJ
VGVTKVRVSITSISIQVQCSVITSLDGLAPVAFAVFQLFFLAALVVYYIFQTIIRIGQQAYITRSLYSRH